MGTDGSILNRSKPDNRNTIYQDLHDNQLVPDAPIASRSASKILNFLFEMLQPESVLDVGCGLGIWLSVARSLGVDHIQGIEGPWLDSENLYIEPDYVLIGDLEKPFDLSRRFDLVISLEVAEHLSPDRAEGFIDNLVHHGDVILFSAAIPFQGGHNHLNEAWPVYWADIFKTQGYQCLDVIRPRIWEDKEIFWHLRQNILLFVQEEVSLVSARETACRTAYHDSPPALVHPEAYSGLFHVLEQLNKIRQRYDHLVKYLFRGGTFHVDITNGELNISRPK